VIAVIVVAVVAAAAGLAIGLMLARRASATEHVMVTPPTPQHGAIVPPASSPSLPLVGAGANPPGVVTPPLDSPPLDSPPLDRAPNEVAQAVAQSVASSLQPAMVAATSVTTNELAPVLARLRELGADGVVDPTEKADLEAKVAAAMPGATVEEIVVDARSYRLRIGRNGADLVASGTWEGGEWAQSVTITQTVTHAFDAQTGAGLSSTGLSGTDLSGIADPQLRSMVEGMLSALDQSSPAPG
jgi:hypothetical protein